MLGVGCGSTGISVATPDSTPNVVCGKAVATSPRRPMVSCARYLVKGTTSFQCNERNRRYPYLPGILKAHVPEHQSSCTDGCEIRSQQSLW
jgi:hypothetical protein